VIQEIETEIQERREVADRLQSYIETYNQLRNVNRAAVEAVAQVLAVELRREGRRSFWTNFTLNYRILCARRSRVHRVAVFFRILAGRRAAPVVEAVVW
jgi:hypothetical protein